MGCTIIAGCGIAGATAASALRELLPEEKIIILDREGSGLYSRIRLPEVLAGKLPVEKLTLSSPAVLREKGIEYLPETRLDSLDPAPKTVSCSGRTLKYDRFIFAVGANASVPPVPGLVPEMTFRSMDDLRRIEAKVSPGAETLVIGGGLLGLEIAESLRERGMKVTVSEIAPRLLPAILSERESAWLADYLEQRGLRILTSASVGGADRTDGGWQVLLNGEKKPFAAVLVSAGIRSETAVAKNAGLEVDRGIVVNCRFETSVRDVYAVGDCAELNGRVYGLWMASKSQGTALAEILAGRLAQYEPPVFSPVPKLPGITLKALREKVAQS